MESRVSLRGRGVRASRLVADNAVHIAIECPRLPASERGRKRQHFRIARMRLRELELDAPAVGGIVPVEREAEDERRIVAQLERSQDLFLRVDRKLGGELRVD